MIKFSISIFYVFVHNRSCLVILPNFNLLRTLQRAFFGPLFPNCYYNFNPCGIFEKMTSFTSIFNQELGQGKLMAALTSRKQTSKKRAL